jgi:hypothetical protein
MTGRKEVQGNVGEMNDREELNSCEFSYDDGAAHPRWRTFSISRCSTASF